MKTALAIVLALIVIAVFGWVSAFKALSKWCDGYVDSSIVKAPAVTTSPLSMSIRELKAIASERKIKGYGRMSKTQLMELVLLNA